MGETKKKRNLAGVITLIILIAAAAAVILLDPMGRMQSMQGSPEEIGEAENRVISVRTTSAERLDLQDYIKSNGNVMFHNSVDVYPEVAGTLTSFDVEVGDIVQKDAAIAAIDPSRPGMVYEKSIVEAPASGTVLSVTYSVGANVSPQLPMATIGNLDDLEIIVPVAERYIGLVSKGQKAELHFPAYEGVAFKGTVTEMSPVLDPASRTMDLTIVLDRPDRRVKVGMFPSVILYTEKRSQVLAVPSSAVLELADGYSVFVASEDGYARQVSVETGMEVDGIIEISSGLETGEQVVTFGQNLITDGAEIKVID